MLNGVLYCPVSFVRDWRLDRRVHVRENKVKMCDAIETVFERFEIVWPPGVADLTL